MVQQSVLVTGGTTGIGKAIAENLRGAGWRVFATSHRAGSGAGFIGDLTRLDEADRLLAWLEVACGGAVPNALVNNAALFTGAEAAIANLNFELPRRLMRWFAEAVKVEGAVVNLLDSDVLGNGVPEGVSLAYVQSKRKLLEETRRAAAAYAPRLRVNAVAPGAISLPAGIHVKAGPRVLRSRPTCADVAEAVRYLLTAKSVTGVVLPVDGGRHLLGRDFLE